MITWMPFDWGGVGVTYVELKFGLERGPSVSTQVVLTETIGVFKNPNKPTLWSLKYYILCWLCNSCIHLYCSYDDIYGDSRCCKVFSKNLAHISHMAITLLEFTCIWICQKNQLMTASKTFLPYLRGLQVFAILSFCTILGVMKTQLLTQ